MSYIFSMERILELRENKEKEIMERFARVQSNLEREKAVLDEFIAELNSTLEVQFGNTIDELRMQHDYREFIKQKIRVQRGLIEEIAVSLEEIRTELIGAQKDRKIMEKLKERDYETYLDDLKTTEQKQLDEVATHCKVII